MSQSKTGSDVKRLILTLMKSGGKLKYARNQKNRDLILKAIFDFNNCMAGINPANMINHTDVANSIILTSEPKGKPKNEQT